MTIKTQPTKRKPTLKIYRTDGVQPGWENRLDSTTSSTYLLHEEMDYSQNRIIPKIGERMGESKRLPDGKIYHHESDWLIAKIQRYPALNEECDWDEIILCYCKFERIESKWERVPTLQELIANEVAKE
jgi:hypothetical protein